MVSKPKLPYPAVALLTTCLLYATIKRKKGDFIAEGLILKRRKKAYDKIVASENGIDLNDCEKVNDAISDLLDEANYIKEQYFLEVSSPGVERKLKTEREFLHYIGKKVSVKLYKAINSKKEFRV